MKNTRKIILMTTLDLPFMILERLSGRSRDREYLFDVYGKSQGFFTLLAIRLLSYPQSSKIIERLGTALGLRLGQVPHGTKIKDYHILQIRAQADSTRFLEAYYRSPTYRNDTFYAPVLRLDSESADSVFLKYAGDRLWHVFENLNVLQSDSGTSITLLVQHGEYPDPLLDQIAETRNIQVQTIKRPGNPFFAVPFAFFLLGGLVWASRRLFRKTSPFVPHAPLVAVEYTDPRANPDRATHPKFVPFQTHGYQIVSYVRSDVGKAYPGEKFEPIEGTHHVHLDELPLHPKDFRLAVYACLRLIKDTVLGRCSSYLAYRHLSLLRLYLDFSALLRRFPLRAHLYNTLANARKTGIRYDSGIITGLCRQFGVPSLSYQTRSNYSGSYEYYFDAFDVFFVWGEAWRDSYQYLHFMRKLEIIGNVSLGPFLEKQTASASRGQKTAQKKLVLFTTDIYETEPFHCTLEIHLQFLKAVITAVEAIEHETGRQEIQVRIKLKDLEHEPLLLRHPEVLRLQEKSGVQIHSIRKDRFDLSEAFTEADAVIAIGFTTPGMDALLMGRPSAYFSPYANQYNSVFRHGTGLVLTSADEIKRFLQGELRVTEAFKDSLDPFRDGNANQRLLNYFHSTELGRL